HRREDKTVWWEYFRLRELDDDGLCEERIALGRLAPTGRERTDKRSVVREFEFPQQECDLEEGGAVLDRACESAGQRASIRAARGLVEPRVGNANKERPLPNGVFAWTHVDARVLAVSLGCAVRYDRTSGYFTASSLTIASRGIEGLVKNEGKMRLIVGCTLSP